MDEDDWNSSERLLSPEKTIVDSCALHKTLLVVVCHHRALLLLSQLSYSTNIGFSRSSFSCLGFGRHEVPAMVYTKSIAHVTCFQSRLCIYMYVNVRFFISLWSFWRWGILQSFNSSIDPWYHVQAVYNIVIILTNIIIVVSVLVVTIKSESEGNNLLEWNFLLALCIDTCQLLCIWKACDITWISIHV
jgi:hypothetical protein